MHDLNSDVSACTPIFKSGFTLNDLDDFTIEDLMGDSDDAYNDMPNLEIDPDVKP